MSAIAHRVWKLGADVDTDQLAPGPTMKFGIDVTARACLATLRPAFAAEVREQERFYQQAGISSVPAIILNDQHLISGGQPPEVFEQALRQIAGI